MWSSLVTFELAAIETLQIGRHRHALAPEQRHLLVPARSHGRPHAAILPPAASARAEDVSCVPISIRTRRSRAATARPNLRVFGSVARGEDTDTSDIDLLVD